MPKYKYRAVNNKGRPVRGVIEADNELDLTARLDEGGLALVDCKEMSQKVGKFTILFSKKVKVRDLIQMFVHLEQMQKAAVPLLEGLADVRDTTDSPRLRDVMSDVYREVAEGGTLSHAMSRHPATFQPIIVSLINAGEETGDLTHAFEHIIVHLKWLDVMMSRVKKATRYPKILIGVVVGVIWMMMGYVVPQVVSFLREMGQALPWVTRSLIAASEFFGNYFLYIIVGAVLSYILLMLGRNLSSIFRYHTDYIALKTPIVGGVIRKISLSQFSQTFSVLFVSGLDILRCIDAAKMTATNLVLIDALTRVRTAVQEGAALSDALKISGEFPPLVVRMVKIGEESGNLTAVLAQVSEFYDRDANEAIDGMIAMIEPILTGVLGIIILWIAAAVFGPIYDSISTMGK